jgi:hypothetical protein
MSAAKWMKLVALALGLVAGAGSAALYSGCCSSYGLPRGGNFRGTHVDRTVNLTVGDGFDVASETFTKDGHVFTVTYAGTAE